MSEEPTRELTRHKINPCNDKIKLLAVGPVCHDGSNNKYRMEYSPNNNSYIQAQSIQFQNGPINDAGVNGITQEVLITILIDRLTSFQRSEYSCRENAIAITKLEEALLWLHSRTIKRIAECKEGTHKV